MLMNLMEDYDKFVQRLSHLRRSEEEYSKPSPAPSLIRVYGRPILPPLLSEKQRVVMQRHRDTAQKATGQRKLKEDPRMSYVQNLLNHLQLRTIPTLEELLRESEIDIKSSNSQNTSGGSVSQSNFFNETTKDSPLLSPPLVKKGEDGLSPPPLASTISSAFLISNVTPQESYNEGCLADQHDSQQGPQPSSPNGAIQESVSSGYATYVENSVFVSGIIDRGSGSCGFGSSEGTYSMDDFFLRSTSNTITKMPKIIIHPPIDGEELEISGLDLSLCNNSIAEQDICCSSFQEDSATCDNLTAEEFESSHLESTENGDNVQSTGRHDLDRDHTLDRSEDPVYFLENSVFSDNPELSDALSTPCNLSTQLHTKHEPTEKEQADTNVAEATPSENPHHMSLQALLKRSQEYREQQRMLRNQSKNTKVQKRNQEPKTRPEEQSLSDKENDGSPCKVTVTPEEKKTRMIESEFTGKITDVKSESKHSTGVTIRNGEPVDGAETTKGEVVFNSFLQEDQSVEHETNLGHQNSHTTVPSTVNVMVPGALSSDHMDWLESNLSSKNLPVSNLENHSQTKSCTESELKSVKHSEQSTNEQHVQLCQNDHDSFPDMLGGADFALHGRSRRPPPPVKCILSAAQQMLIPDVFRNLPSEIVVQCNASVLSDTSNHPVDRRNEMAMEGHDTSLSRSLNKSYDVETPSGLWLLNKSGSDSGSKSCPVQGKHLTPESRDVGQGGVSKVKRRLLMHTAEETKGRSPDTNGRGVVSVVRPSSSIPTAAVLRNKGHGSQKNQEQLKEVHASQIRALRDNHKRQQEQLLQKALAARYHLLQRVSSPWSVSTSRLRDTMTFSTLYQPSSSLPERYRHLLSAAVKGFLTRRLMRTERVAELVRTIRDTQQFLLSLQLQGTNGGEMFGREDLLLQNRVTLQLSAARFEVNNIFFSLSARERMQLISWDRHLTREREFRQQSGGAVQPRQKGCLSTVTQKALERKRGVITTQKKATETYRKVVNVKKTGHRNGHKTGFSAEKPQEAKRGHFRANPLRVPKNSYSTRPR
ncbi:centriolar coiled-coil protein of 110 kDa isoform X1 [Paralichthys olivaceus]|uniref:centriolar coiled-coil protein of 110 kDa isoform X1 n=1 Tax=Paralichthys olivaceus TaxID=8255 RepID=UPI00374FE497